MTLCKSIGLIALVLLFCGNARADLLLVLSQQSPLYLNFEKGFAAALSQRERPTVFASKPATAIAKGADLHAYTGIIAAGVEAAKAVALADTVDIPVIYTMLPETSFGWLRNNGMLAKRHQVLYIDQPSRRLVNLVKTALPATKTLGYVYGEPELAHVESLRAQAKAQQMDLREIKLQPNTRFVDSLMNDLSASDAVLVLPDPYLFNRRTVQSVLLASFRLRKPLIAYSESFLNAGALLALFSTAEQIGRQTAEMIDCLERVCGESQITEFYPRYFSLQLNPLVARQLGLTLKSADELLRLLQAQELGGRQ